MKKVLILLLLLSPLFFYNLNGYNLVDFDEAWFGEIAKNMVKNHDLFLLYFNDKPFLDHPPFGYILIAISILIFGANEFAVRFPSALCGFLSLILTYLVGRKLFNGTVGLGASLILASGVWFIFRSRSGDLDAPLVFLFLLTFYIAIHIKEKPKLIYTLPLSFAALFLVKAFIGLIVVFPIAAYFVLNRVKIPIGKILISFLIFILSIGPWFYSNFSAYGIGYFENLIKLGIRSSGTQRINYLEIFRSQTFTYLHFGIRKWYYPALIALALSWTFILKKKNFKESKNLIPLYLWIGILLYGFLTNKKTEIWHLLPMYPPLALLISFFTYKIFSMTKSKNLAKTLAIATILLISAKQIYSFRNEIKLIGSGESGPAHVAKAAKNYNGNLFLDSELTTPAVPAFYSDKQVNIVKLMPPPQNTLKGIFEFGPRPLLLMTEIWKLDLDGISPDRYQILSEHLGHLLVKVL